jgi:uncharacterized protein YegJ (DUF2314 family)
MSKVFLSDYEDPEMQAAVRKARETFRIFWREVAWERRRIVPGLDTAVVKAPFSDGPSRKRAKDNTPDVEHMWVSDVDFDGKDVTGTLLNNPNWIKSVKEGDAVRVPLDQVSDWMYVIGGDVYGAYTVNLLRSRMGRKERQEHDEAWGLNFGDPTKVRTVPDKFVVAGEHAMSEAMAGSLKEQLAKDPSLVRSKDDRGWTLLHQEALAGSAPTVKVLLNAGADPTAKTADGRTPLDLARCLGWDRVVALLTPR